MAISWWQAFTPIVTFIKNHQLSETFVKSSQLNEIQDFLGEVLQLALKLENLNVQLEFQNEINIAEWAKYDKELETLVKRINENLGNNPYFALSTISYKNYSHEISKNLEDQDYETASDLRLQQIKLRDQILLTWVKYYLNIARKLGLLNNKIGINDTDTVELYLEGLMKDLQEDE